MRWTMLLFVGLTGCVVFPKVVVLRELETPVGPRDLQAQRVYVHVTAADDTLERDARDGAVVRRPASYDLPEWTSEKVDLWRSLADAAIDDRDAWTQVGWTRNGYGIKMGGVYSSVSPAHWVEESVALHLQSRGALIVHEPSMADITLSGRVLYTAADMYFAWRGDLVVAWTQTKQGGAPRTDVLHTRCGAVAWLASRWEVFKVLRDCGGQMSTLVGDSVAPPK